MLDLRAIQIAARIEHAAGRLPTARLGELVADVQREAAALPGDTASGRLQQASVLAAGGTGLLEKAVDGRIAMVSRGGLNASGRRLHVQPAIVAEQTMRADTTAMHALTLLQQARATVAAAPSLPTATAAIDDTIAGARALRARLTPWQELSPSPEITARHYLSGHAGAETGEHGDLWRVVHEQLGLADGMARFPRRMPNEDQLAVRLLAPELTGLDRARALGAKLAQMADDAGAVPSTAGQLGARGRAGG